MDMQGAFDPENGFWSFIGKVCDICLLSLLWLVCSLGVITSGAATVSLLSYALKQADDTEGYALRSFFAGFRRSFWGATLLWLTTIIMGCIVFGNFYAVGALSLPNLLRLPLYSLALCLVFLFSVTVVWSYALYSSFSITPFKAVRDALPAAFRYPVRTLLALFCFALAVVASWLLPPFFFVWFALAIFFCAMVLKVAILELRLSS